MDKAVGDQEDNIEVKDGMRTLIVLLVYGLGGLFLFSLPLSARLALVVLLVFFFINQSRWVPIGSFWVIAGTVFFSGAVAADVLQWSVNVGQSGFEGEYSLWLTLWFLAGASTAVAVLLTLAQGRRQHPNQADIGEWLTKECGRRRDEVGTVVCVTRVIEAWLIRLGATGKGLQSRARSLSEKNPEFLVAKSDVNRLALYRNRLLHPEEVEVEAPTLDSNEVVSLGVRVLRVLSEIDPDGAAFIKKKCRERPKDLRPWAANVMGLTGIAAALLIVQGLAINVFMFFDQF